MTIISRRWFGLVGCVSLVLVTGCAAFQGAQSSGGTGPETPTGKIPVVASINVWASVVEAIGGDAVSVEPLISDPNVNPHGYETKPSDAAKVNKASLVVYNGAGYDVFVEKILKSSGAKTGLEVHTLAKTYGTAVDDPHGEEEGEEKEKEEEESVEKAGFEHYWYDLTMVRAAAAKIAERLIEIRPDIKDTVYANVKAFMTKLTGLSDKADKITSTMSGAKIMVTEPICALLMDRLKLKDIAPKGFAIAIEDGRDPSAGLIGQSQQVITSKSIAVLLYSPQSENSILKKLKELAVENQIPVVNMTETLPAGKDYTAWMSDNLTNMANALR